MSNPTNWPIVTDAETYFRHQEKRVLHEQRRPIVGHGNIVGPGISPLASEVDDWNDDVCRTNGYFWSAYDAPNAPPPTLEGPYEDVETTNYWVGHVVSRGDEGYQSLRLLNSDGGSSPFPEVSVVRQWNTSSDGGLTKWGAWTNTSTQPWWDSEMLISAQALTTTLHCFVPFYAASEYSQALVTITVTVDNNVDTAGVLREFIFWPSWNDALGATPPLSGAFGHWSHYGRGDVGFSETTTVSKTWIMELPFPEIVGDNVLRAAVRGIAGAPIDIEQIDIHATQVR